MVGRHAHVELELLHRGPGVQDALGELGEGLVFLEVLSRS